MVFVLAGGPHRTGRPISLMIGTAAGAALIAAASFTIAFGRGRSMLGRPRRWLIAASLLVPVGLFAWKMAWSARYVGMQADSPARLGLRCFGLSVAMAICPLAAVLWSRRSSDPLHPVTTGVALGVAIGASGWVLTDLWCPVGYPRHVLIGHVLPILVLAVVGAMAGRRLIALRLR
jgi:hypothetical protein